MAITLWLALPGLGWSLWWTASCTLSPLSVVALAVPAGIVLIATTGFLLALAGVLTPASAVLTWVVILGVGWFGAVRRGGLSVRWKVARRAVREAPVVTAIGAFMLLAFAAVRATYGTDRNLAPTALRYWADGVEIADAGEFPRLVLHWGVEVPPTMSKVLLNVLYAQESFMLGRDPLPPLAASLFVVSIAMALLVTAFLLEAGLRRATLAVAVVLLGAAALPGLSLAGDLRTLVAEDWGRTLAFAALVTAVVALRSDDRRQARRLAVFAGIFLGAGAGTHLVAALGGAVVIAALGVGWSVAEHRWRSASIAVLTVGAVAILVEGAVLLAAPGELGFQAATGDSGYESIRQELGKPESFDPVVYLVTEGHPERFAAVSSEPLAVLESLGHKLAGAEDRAETPEGSLPLVVGASMCLVGLAVVLLIGDRGELRALAVGSAVALLVFVAIVVGFAARFETFALANFGVRRLSQYVGLVLVLLVGTALEALVIRSRPRASVAMGIALAVLAAAATLPFATADVRKSAQSDLLAFDWIADNVPCEGRVLVDRRTLASVESLAGRAGVVEGMGPHLRPSLLLPAIDAMEQAQRFFTRPEEGADYLSSHGIAAVMTSDTFWSRFGGWSVLSRVEPDRMAQAPFLSEAYRGERITIYTVNGPGDDVTLPKVSGRPGFGC